MLFWSKGTIEDIVPKPNLDVPKMSRNFLRKAQYKTSKANGSTL